MAERIRNNENKVNDKPNSEGKSRDNSQKDKKSKSNNRLLNALNRNKAESTTKDQSALIAKLQKDILKLNGANADLTNAVNSKERENSRLNGQVADLNAKLARSKRAGRPPKAPSGPRENVVVKELDLLKRAVAPFPTSPLPRQSLGRHTVCVRPPKRDQTNLTLDEDYRIPENHMVFFAIPKKEARLNMKGVPQSSHQRRVGVVGNVFSNWYSRSFEISGNDAENDFYVRFAGVSYEGIDDPQGARRHPDSKGRFTISINGVVTIYTRTDQLEKEGAKLGDPLEWIPVGCKQSWKQLGPKFEPCRVRVWKRDNYIESKSNKTRVTKSQMAAIDTSDEMINTGLEKNGATVVPTDQDGRTRYDRIEGFTQTSSDYEHLLRLLNFSEDEIKDHPVAGAYLELVRKLGEGNPGSKLPFGIDEKSGDHEDAKFMESENFLTMIGAMLASGMIMNKNVRIEDDGRGQQTMFAPAQFIVQLFQEIRQNGLNPESMDYLYPGDFQEALRKYKNVEGFQEAVQRLADHRIIVVGGNPPKLRLDMTAYANVADSDRQQVRRDLEKLSTTIGDATGRLLFTSALAAVYETMEAGGTIKYPTSSPSHVYTWDLVHQMAEKLKEAKDVSDKIYKIEQLVQEGGMDNKAEIVNLLNQIVSSGTTVESRSARQDIVKGIAELLRNPMIGISEISDETTIDNTDLPGQIDKAREKLKEVDDRIRDLANAVGVEPSIMGGLSVDTMQEILQKVEEISADANYSIEAESGITKDLLFPDRLVDLIIKEVRRERLTPAQHHYVMQQLTRLNEKAKVDPAVLRNGIRAFVDAASDSSLQLYGRVAGPFSIKIQSLESNVKKQLTNAVNHYLHASDLAQDTSNVVQGYIAAIDDTFSENQDIVNYLPTILRNMQPHRRDDAIITTSIFVGCIHLAGCMARYVFNGQKVESFGDMFKSDNKFPWAIKEENGQIMNESTTEMQAVYLPPMVLSHDAMYGLTRSICDQILTMLCNTVAFGAMLCAMASDPEANSTDFDTDKFDLFKFPEHAKNAMQEPLFFDFLGSDDQFDNYKLSMSGSVQGNRIVTKIDSATTRTDIDIGTLNPRNPDDLKEFLDWLNAHMAICKSERYTVSIARLYTRSLRTVISDMKADYDTFVTRVEDNVKAQGDDATVQGVLNKLSSDFKVSADQFAVKFSTYLPKDDLYDDREVKSAQQPCYFHDHPLAAALYCGEYVGKQYTPLAAKAWCCPLPEDGYEAICSIRPHGSMAPLATFFEAVLARDAYRVGPDEQAFQYAQDIVQEFLNLPKQESTSIDNTSTAMRVAQQVLPPDEFARRSRKVARHSRAMKRSMMNAVRSAFDARVGHVAVTSAQAGKFYDDPDYVDIFDLEDVDSKESVLANPRQRVFGTLLGIQENMIRVMLNPALSL